MRSSHAATVQSEARYEGIALGLAHGGRLGPGRHAGMLAHEACMRLLEEFEVQRTLFAQSIGRAAAKAVRG